MIPRRLGRGVVQMAAAVVLAIGVGHLAMPKFGYHAADLSGLTPSVRAHFVDLGTYAIGIFLAAFAGLTWVVSREQPTRITYIFYAVMLAVWMVRLGLEFAFPVDLPIFFLGHPHPVLLVVLSGITLGYAMALASLWSPRPRRGELTVDV